MKIGKRTVLNIALSAAVLGLRSHSCSLIDNNRALLKQLAQARKEVVEIQEKNRQDLANILHITGNKAQEIVLDQCLAAEDKHGNNPLKKMGGRVPVESYLKCLRVAKMAAPKFSTLQLYLN